MKMKKIISFAFFMMMIFAAFATQYEVVGEVLSSYSG
jgi:hypothetical protein